MTINTWNRLLACQPFVSHLSWRMARRISAIRDAAQRLASMGETELQQVSAALRNRVLHEGPDVPAVQIEAKEGVRITAEKWAEAQITRQRYFRLYERLCG
ncbi:MAG: hypothetical protein ACYC4N_26285, partial [Pirellulaceae bacterium]